GDYRGDPIVQVRSAAVAESLPAFNPPLLGGEFAFLFGIEVGWLIVVLVALGMLALVCWRWPFRFLVQWPCYALARLVYRMRVLGSENIPKTSAALVCSNHVSYVDWIFLLAVVKRPIRFVIFEAWTRRFGLRQMLRWMRALPIDAWSGPRAIV